MKPNHNFSSPNYDPVQIPVEFLVLHYTAGNLESTLALFLDPSKEVSSHIVIDESGGAPGMLAGAVGWKLRKNGKNLTTSPLVLRS